MATRQLVLGPARDRPAAGVEVVADEQEPLHRRLMAFLRASRSSSDARLVDAHFALYAALPILLGPVRRRPLVVHFHGPWAGEATAAGRGRAAPVKAALEGAVYRRADRVVVLSHSFGTLVRDEYGVRADRVRVIPPGVDLERFTPDRDGARRRLGVPPERPLLVSARRLVPRMGLDVLVRAMSRLPEGVHLVVAGDGPEGEPLRQAAVALGVHDRVHLLGRIDDAELVDWYRAADVAVLPSLSLEGFGLVALEALACGTPVVASRVGGLPEVVGPLDPGLVVEPGDPEALAARLAAVLAGAAPSRERCRQYAEGFTWRRAARAHVDLYEELAPVDGGAERPLDVVVLDHCAQMSGAEIAALRLLPHLTRTRVRVVLAEDGPLRPRLEEAGISTEVLPLAEHARGLRRAAVGHGPPLRSLLATGRYVLALRRDLRRTRPDLVHANSLKAGLYGTVAARAAGVPVVWHARDRIAADSFPRPVVALVRAVVWALADGVLANSRATLATLPGAGARGRPARVVPDPYEPAESRGPKDPPAGSALRFAIVGRLAPWKGQRTFLEAFADAFPDGGHRATVMGAAFFGDDGEERALRCLVDELGVSGRVDFTGHVDDVEQALGDIDVLVHASLVPEPFGQVVVEGMAAGLAVVAVDAGGPAEVVRHGHDGLLTPLGDVAALSSAMQRLAADPALRERLGRAAQDSARAYRPDRIAGAVEELYRDVLRRSARRRGRRGRQT